MRSPCVIFRGAPLRGGLWKSLGRLWAGPSPLTRNGSGRNVQEDCEVPQGAAGLQASDRDRETGEPVFRGGPGAGRGRVRGEEHNGAHAYPGGRTMTTGPQDDSIDGETPEDGVSSAPGLVDGESPMEETPDVEPPMEQTSDAETALVEIAPGTALVFGRVPDGLDVVPFRLVSNGDLDTIKTALMGSSGILNAGGQFVNSLAQAHGLVRLAPQTLHAMQAGMLPVQSGGYNIGVLAHGGKFAAQVRWLPASGATMAGVVAAVGPAMAMMAIQVQLNELNGLVKGNISLTTKLLETVRAEQWAELSGLDRAVGKAIGEAERVGQVTPHVWDSVRGHEAELEKQRELFRRNVDGHVRGLKQEKEHAGRRRYLGQNSEAILADAYGLLVAHSVWFRYEALRAGHVRLTAETNEYDATLLALITHDAQAEYETVVETLSTMLGALQREMWMLAELPGKRTIPFVGKGRTAREVAEMSRNLLAAVEKLSGVIAEPRPPLVRPDTVCVPAKTDVSIDLRILEWHLDPDEVLQAIAQVAERSTGDVMVAVTDKRILVAQTSDFHRLGLISRTIAGQDIRYVRLRDDADGEEAPSNPRTSAIDLITRSDNFRWRLRAGTPRREALALVALLAERMNLPEIERDALLKFLPTHAGIAAAVTA